MRNSISFIALASLGLTSPKIVAQSDTKFDPSSRIEGNYKVSRMTFFTTGQAPQVVDMNQPGNKMSALITAKRKSERYVSLTFSQFQNTTQQLSFRYGDAYLRTTTKGYDLAIDGNKMGTVNGTALTIDISASDSKTGKKRRSLIICKKS